MKAHETLKLLARHKAILARQFGVADLALFGSTARDAARPDSDIDVLVTFNGPATSKRYFGVQFYLEDLFGRPVDLVTDKALRPELRPFVEREAIKWTPIYGLRLWRFCRFFAPKGLRMRSPGLPRSGYPGLAEEMETTPRGLRNDERYRPIPAHILTQPPWG